MKWIKRVLLLLGILLTLVIALGLIGYYMARQEPAGYRRYGFELQDRARLNQQALDKLVAARNQAAARLAAERRARTESRPAPMAPRDSLTIRISEEELNAILQHHFQYKLDAYIEHGSILLEGGKIIVAAKVRELGAVASAHFQMEVDGQGKLQLRMTGRYLGRVPLPEALFDKQAAKLRGKLMQESAELRPRAKLTPDGRANTALAELGAMRLMMSMLDHSAAEPVLFLWDEDKWVMLRIEQVAVENREVKLTVRAMSAEQRAEAAGAILR